MACTHPFGADLPARVADVFDRCMHAEPPDVEYDPSSEWERDLAPSARGVGLRVRCVPARAHKPSGDGDKDPFKPPYGPNLVAQAVDESSGKEFAVLINAAPIEARAMLLLPTRFEPQSDGPTPVSLRLAYAIVCDFEERGQPLRGFFNVGEASAASQPHLHFQFVPIRKPAPLEPAVDRAAQPSTPGRVSVGTESTAASMLSTDLMPFSHAFIALDPRANTESSLFAAYQSCLSRVSADAQPDSYFVIVRPSWLMVVPRAEGHIDVDGQDTAVGAGAMLGHIHVAEAACADAIELAGSDAIWRLIADSGLPR